MKIKVLHFVPGFDHGGIESRLIDWYKNIDKTKFHFDLVVSKNIQNNKLIEEFIGCGGNVYQIPAFTFKNIFKFKSELGKIFKNNQYDVVHCHNPVTGSIFLQQAKKYGIRHRIMHSRTNQFSKDSKYLKIREYLKRRTVKNSNIYLACSNRAGEWLFQNEKFEIIKNGIFTKKFRYNPETRNEIRKELNIKIDDIVLGTVGRLTGIKNHKLILDILEQLKMESDENYKFILLGDGPLKLDLEKQIQEKNLVENVLLLGKKDDIFKYYQAMDIFLFPSEHEGFGTVAIEAQSSGLKTIISDGVPDEVIVTDLVKQLPLNPSLKFWVDEIRNSSNYERFDRSKEVSTKGFDVSSTVLKLEKIYEKR